MSEFKEVEPGRYVFWDHDQFPYVLGGEVTHENEWGQVWTKEFGQGYAFAPIKEMPVAEGQKLRTQLKQIKDLQREAVNKVKAAWRSRLDELLAPAGIVLDRPKETST